MKEFLLAILLVAGLCGTFAIASPGISEWEWKGNTRTVESGVITVPGCGSNFEARLVYTVGTCRGCRVTWNIIADLEAGDTIELEINDKKSLSIDGPQDNVVLSGSVNHKAAKINFPDPTINSVKVTMKCADGSKGSWSNRRRCIRCE